MPIASTAEAWPQAAAADPDSHAELLAVDPWSPRGLVLSARKARWGKAERRLRAARQFLPEYGDALLELARLLRRQRRHSEVLELVLEEFTTPLAFGSLAARRLCFAWLRRAPDAALPGCVDPIWLRRHRLTLAEAVRWNDDYLLYEEAIEGYHELGFGVRAVRLRILVGELMGLETVSFRERYGWSFELHVEKLRRDLGRASLPPR